MLKPGDVLGDYRLTAHFAAGGMARLFRGVDERDGREVVVKLLPATAEADARERFEREVRVLAGLDHPRIVPLLASGTVENQPYLVLPYLPRGDLGDRIAREDGPLPLPLVRRIALQLCDALAYAHLRGVVHRDLKPANVLFDGAGDVQLADFGIALAAGNARLTQAGKAIGTPEYFAPEQALGSADMRSDVYALGLILFQLATGRLPFAAHTPAEWLQAHREQPVPSLLSLNPDVPEPFERVVLHALAKAPDARFQSAAEMAAALRQALPQDDTPTLFKPRPPGIPTPLPPSRTPTQALPKVAAGLLCLLLVGVGYAIWRVMSRAPSPPVAESVPVAVPAVPATTAATEIAVPPKPHYDDFANPAYDGAYDRARWTATTDDVRLVQRQADGALHVRSVLREQGLSSSIEAASLARVALRVRLADPVLADESTIGVVLLRADRPQEWVSCYLYATRGGLRATPTCTDAARREFRTGRAVNTGQYVVLELVPDRKESVLFSVDGEALGKLPLVQGEAKTTWYVTVTAWSGDGKAVEGDVDWIDIEP